MTEAIESTSEYIYKKLGETPLEAIERYRKEQNLGDIPLTYAGRLDPAAEGVLPVLRNPTPEQKNELLKLDKTYRATFLLGVATDTGDLLGVPYRHLEKEVSENLVQAAVKLLKGKHMLPYPMYSSKKVEGKQLWEWARKGTSPVEVPTREMVVYRETFLKLETLPIEAVVDRVEYLIGVVTGDFRQEKILASWKQLQFILSSVQCVEVELRVASGTYVRSLTEVLGKQLRVPCSLFSLVRTAVGETEG